MGREKHTSESEQFQSQEIEQTAGQQALNQLQLSQLQAADPFQQAFTQAGLQFGTDIFGGLGSGESENFAINQLLQGLDPQQLVDEALLDVASSAQLGGILDSGVAAQAGIRTAADIGTNVQQFNLGNLLNLANLGFSGGTQIQQPLVATGGQLQQSLSGLNTIIGRGINTGKTTGPNPFLQSFQQSLGQSFGSGSFGSGGSNQQAAASAFGGG